MNRDDGVPAVDGSAPAASGVMTALPGTLKEIREFNPELDEEQAHRAHLLPAGVSEEAGREAGGIGRVADPDTDGLGYSSAQWDLLVDSLTMSRWNENTHRGVSVPKLHRESPVKLNRRSVQLYTASFAETTVVEAARAGFFLFGSEFEFPGVPLARRSLLNLELCNEPTDLEGRIVLEGIDALTIGKRALRGLCHVGVLDGVGGHSRLADNGDSGGAAHASRPGHAYSLTVSRQFDTVVARIIEQHGIDWVGFAAIQSTLAALAGRTAVAQDGTEVRVVSLELWSQSTSADEHSVPAELVSGEIGYIVGSCYTCLSLFADDTNHPRCSRIRVQAAHLWLARAGVTLFDAGTTAAYFLHLHGYHRTNRREFAALWRIHRDKPLHAPVVLESECPDVYELLQARLSSVGSERPAAAAHPTKRPRSPSGTAGDADQPGAKGVGVRVRWDSGVTIAREQLISLFAVYGAVRKVMVVRPGEAVVVFNSGSAAHHAVATVPTLSDPCPMQVSLLMPRKKRRKDGVVK
jgi:hypothetical protein